jgi:hypothetical protein
LAYHSLYLAVLLRDIDSAFKRVVRKLRVLSTDKKKIVRGEYD